MSVSYTLSTRRQTDSKQTAENQYERFEDSEKLNMHRVHVIENQRKNKKSHSLAVQKSRLKKKVNEENFLSNCLCESFIFLKKKGRTF